MSEEPRCDTRPWSARRPQSVVLSVLLVVLIGALVAQAVSSIKDGLGGFVPYLMILGGPALAGYYVWYLVFRRFEDDLD